MMVSSGHHGINLSPLTIIIAAFFFLFANIAAVHHPAAAAAAQVEPLNVVNAWEESDMVPLEEEGEGEGEGGGKKSRRKLSSFRLCALCTCCTRRGVCLPSPCCYAINCNIPNRPFGFCSFTPKTCNCFRCHL